VETKEKYLTREEESLQDFRDEENCLNRREKEMNKDNENEEKSLISEEDAKDEKAKEIPMDLKFI